MASVITLLSPHPALMVDVGERVLVVADLHLGLEVDLAKQGINIPFQWGVILERLLGLVREHTPERLLILGDVKHGVPATSFQEKQAIPTFFKALLEEVPRIDVCRGNHDSNIEALLPPQVTLHSSKGVLLGEDLQVAAMHGHAWPDPQSLTAETLLIGHNHPTVSLSTPLGVRFQRPVWLRGSLNTVGIVKAVLEGEGVRVGDSDPLELFRSEYGVDPRLREIIVVPMFNELLGGLPVNLEPPESLLGPLFREHIVDLGGFEAFLLDGTYLGCIDFLREHHSIEDFSRQQSQA